MRAGIRPPGEAVAVEVEVAAQALAGLEDLVRQHLSPIVVLDVVPFERVAQALVHADVEVVEHEDRRLQAVGEIEGLGRHLEALLRILRKEEHVLGVAV